MRAHLSRRTLRWRTKEGVSVSVRFVSVGVRLKGSVLRELEEEKGFERVRGGKGGLNGGTAKDGRLSIRLGHLSLFIAI